LVSSTAYFDRKVIESEDETDFIWTALLPAVTATPGFNLPGPIPSGITEEKNYQRFVQEVRFASQLSGPLQFVAGVFYSDLHGALPFASNYLSALAPGYGAALNAAGTCNVVGLCPNPDNPSCDGVCSQNYVCPYLSSTDYRGNVTQVTSYANATPVTPTGAMTETRRYDVTGNLVTASTACCEQTSFNYTIDTQESSATYLLSVVGQNRTAQVGFRVTF